MEPVPTEGESERFSMDASLQFMIILRMRILPQRQRYIPLTPGQSNGLSFSNNALAVIMLTCVIF